MKFNADFLSGFEIACGAVTAIGLIRSLVYLPIVLFWLVGEIVDVITGPQRRHRERIEKAEQAAKLEAEAKRMGFASGEVFTSFLRKTAYKTHHIYPETVLGPGEYTVPSWRKPS